MFSHFEKLTWECILPLKIVNMLKFGMAENQG